MTLHFPYLPNFDGNNDMSSLHKVNRQILINLKKSYAPTGTITFPPNQKWSLGNINWLIQQALICLDKKNGAILRLCSKFEMKVTLGDIYCHNQTRIDGAQIDLTAHDVPSPNHGLTVSTESEDILSVYAVFLLLKRMALICNREGYDHTLYLTDQDGQQLNMSQRLSSLKQKLALASER